MFFCKLCKFSSNTSGERSESVGSWLHVYKITKKHIPLNSDPSPQSGDLRNLSPLAHCWWPHVLTCSKQTPKMGVPFHAFIPEIQDTLALTPGFSPQKTTSATIIKMLPGAAVSMCVCVRACIITSSVPSLWRTKIHTYYESRTRKYTNAHMVRPALSNPPSRRVLLHSCCSLFNLFVRGV